MEVIFQYLKEAEDGLTDVYRRLGAVPPPSNDDIQRDIANVVVLLYGLRRAGASASLAAHEIVFSGRMQTPEAMAAGAD